MSEQPSPKIITDPKLLSQVCLALLGMPRPAHKTESSQDPRIKTAYDVYLEYAGEFEHYVRAHGYDQRIAHKGHDRDYNIDFLQGMLPQVFENINQRRDLAFMDSERKLIEAGQSVYRQIFEALKVDALHIDEAVKLASSDIEKLKANKDKHELEIALKYAEAMVENLNAMAECIGRTEEKTAPQKKKRSPDAVKSWTPSKAWPPLDNNQPQDQDLFYLSTACLALLGDTDAIKSLKAVKSIRFTPIYKQANAMCPVLDKLTRTPSNHHHIVMPDQSSQDLDVIKDGAMDVIQAFQREKRATPEDVAKIAKARDIYNAIGVKAAVDKSWAKEIGEAMTKQLSNYTATVASQLDLLITQMAEIEKRDNVHKTLVLLGDKEATLNMRSGDNTELRRFAEKMEQEANLFSRVITSEMFGESDLLTMEIPVSGNKKQTFTFDKDIPSTCTVLRRMTVDPNVPLSMSQHLQYAQQAYAGVANWLKEHSPNRKPGDEISRAIDFANIAAGQLGIVHGYAKQALEEWKKRDEPKGLW